jgi:long-chain-acyl-CoA dehydrogenase
MSVIKDTGQRAALPPFDEEHEELRETVSRFVSKEIAPHVPEWEDAREFPRELYGRCAELGFLGLKFPEEYGGQGGTHLHDAVWVEELARSGGSGGVAASLNAHTSIAMPPIFNFGTEEQKQRWVVPGIAGEKIGALGITEPGAGSDVAGLRTAAELAEDGSHYLLNGSKTFVSGGAQADLVLVACRTSADRSDRRGGLSLLAVDTRAPGVTVDSEPVTLGLRSSDIVQMTFTDVRVPVGDVLGEPGGAFACLADIFPQERLGIAVGAYAQAAAAVHLTTEYVRERTAFGKPLAAFQNTKFVLADCKVTVNALQAVVDQALDAFDSGELTAEEAAATKLYCTETAVRVLDKCLQLHGGLGFTMDHPIARLYADNRASRIFGGTSEIMRTIVAKSMGL